MEYSHMKIERLDRVAIGVKNLTEATRFFSDLLGTDFYNVGVVNLSRGVSIRVAICPLGLELLEQVAPPVKVEELRSFHFKVSDLDEAKTEMEGKGFHPDSEVQLGRLKQVAYNVHGIRLLLVEYDAPDVVAAIRNTKLHNEESLP